MIFNSINKELSHSTYSNQYRTSQTTGNYYQSKCAIPSPLLSPSTPLHHLQADTPHTTQQQSSISKMNSRISDNIGYLKFRDQMRNSELRSSKASVRSNCSHNSNHSQHSRQSSIKPSRPSVYQPINRSRIDGEGREKGGLHYRRVGTQPSGSQIITRTPSYYPATRSVLEAYSSRTGETFRPSQSILESRAAPLQELTREDVKNFTRQPVTIDMSNIVVNRQSGYMLGNRPEKDLNSPTQFRRSSFAVKSSGSEEKHVDMEDIRAHLLPPKQEESSVGTPSHLSNRGTQESYKTPLDWKDIENWREGLQQCAPESVEQEPVICTKAVETKRVSFAVPTESGSARSDDQVVVGVRRESSRRGMMVASGLIAFGIIIFLLQLAK